MLDGNTGQQLVQETLPAFSAFSGNGAGDAMGEFEHGQDRDGDSLVTSFQRYGLEKLAVILTLAFGGNGGRDGRPHHTDVSAIFQHQRGHAARLSGSGLMNFPIVPEKDERRSNRRPSGLRLKTAR